MKILLKLKRFELIENVSQKAAQTNMDFQFGFWADPIYLTKDYPPSVRAEIGDKLPQFTEEEKHLLGNAGDFLGLNHYTSSYGFDLIFNIIKSGCLLQLGFFN